MGALEIQRAAEMVARKVQVEVRVDGEVGVKEGAGSVGGGY